MTNILYTKDNLYILSGMNSETVDLIYLDPPFNSKRTYSAPIGSKSAGASFKDMWSWDDVDEAYLNKMFNDYPSIVNFIQSVKDVHSKAMMAYLTYMAQRWVEMHRVLKPTGSLYLHCDPTASHYLKPLTDAIFGHKNFVNEIIWHYQTGGAGKRHFAKKHDVIFWYVKEKGNQVFNADDVRLPFTPHKQDKKGKNFGGRMGVDADGREYVEKWGTGKKKIYRYYLDEGKIPPDVWVDIQSIQSAAKERMGYPTQKPLALLDRIIKASSNKGDVVFDPFCGCATSCVKAQMLERKWIGIDIEAKAAEVLVERLSDEAGLFKDFIHTTQTPQRSDVTIEKPSLSIKQRLFKEQKGACKGCEHVYLIKDLEIDHIVPKSKGGGDFYENYQLLCGNCNRMKGNKPMEFLRLKIKARNELLKTEISFG